MGFYLFDMYACVCRKHKWNLFVVLVPALYRSRILIASGCRKEFVWSNQMLEEIIYLSRYPPVIIVASRYFLGWHDNPNLLL